MQTSQQTGPPTGSRGLSPIRCQHCVSALTPLHALASDALEAYLLDGECMQKWAASAVSQVTAHRTTSTMEQPSCGCPAASSELAYLSEVAIAGMSSAEQAFHGQGLLLRFPTSARDTAMEMYCRTSPMVCCEPATYLLTCLYGVEQAHAWLSTAVLSPGGVDAGALRSQLGRVNSVVLVLRALAAPQPAPPVAALPAAAGSEASAGGDLEAALHLQQCLQVCCVCDHITGLRKQSKPA